MPRGSARTAVIEATVILTNPTHFAVVLRYRPGIDAAPLVVARGCGATVNAIRELAAEHDVPLLPYPQLARAIYFTAQTGHVICEDPAGTSGMTAAQKAQDASLVLDGVTVTRSSNSIADLIPGVKLS